MEYFKSLTQADLISLIELTKKELFLCIPSLHPEVVYAICNLSYSHYDLNTKVGIHLLIDFDAQTFRQGYGSHESVEYLLNGRFKINNFPGNRISFIISDDSGYYLFIESRSLIPAEKETINAIKIDPVSLVRLKKYFFSTSSQTDFEDQLTNAIIKESRALNETEQLLQINSYAVREITEEERDIVAKDITSNPPLNPDYKRLVDFYANKFQYVRLKFEGSNLKSYKIDLPPDALPIKDAALKRRLETKLNLFDSDKANETFEALITMKSKVDELREKFLTKVKSREESLLNKLKQREFQKSVEALMRELEDTKQKTLTAISNLIPETKDRLFNDLKDFLEENALEVFPKLVYLWKENPDQLKLICQSEAEEIVSRKINWPKPYQLVDKFKFIVHYSDITFQDLKNKEFVQELKEAGLINSNDENELAEFARAIKV